MKKLIIALIFISSLAYASDVYKVQGVIKLSTQAEVVQAYLNNDNTDVEGINLTRANKELSVVSRDDKTLTINMFYDTLAKAQAIYNYLVAQAGDMQDMENDIGVSKSQVKLLQTTNDVQMRVRRKGDKCINSYIK